MMIRKHSKRFQFYFIRVALIASIVGVNTFAIAQSTNFPNKPIKVVVTYPSGGSSDLITRIVGQKLTEIWSQPTAIENRPGVAGSIGMEYAANQPRDGYVLTIGNLGPVAVNPLISKVNYSMEKDFVPVTMVAGGPNILVVNTKSKYAKLIKDNNIKAE